MNYYAGLDVSLEETAICVVDETGRIVKEARAASEPEALDRRLAESRSAAGADRPGGLLADGLASRWAARRRLAGDLHRDAPGQRGDEDDAEQDRPQRRPRAWRRSCARAGIRQVHVKSRQCRLWRSLLVARRTVLNEMRTIENVVRAILREAGLKLGTPVAHGLRRARARTGRRRCRA